MVELGREGGDERVGRQPCRAPYRPPCGKVAGQAVELQLRRGREQARDDVPGPLVRIVAGKDDEARSAGRRRTGAARAGVRSEEHTSELQSLMRISYAVFCLKKKKQNAKYKKYQVKHDI